MKWQIDNKISYIEEEQEVRKLNSLLLITQWNSGVELLWGEEMGFTYLISAVVVRGGLLLSLDMLLSSSIPFFVSFHLTTLWFTLLHCFYDDLYSTLQYMQCTFIVLHCMSIKVRQNWLTEIRINSIYLLFIGHCWSIRSVGFVPSLNTMYHAVSPSRAEANWY